MHRWPLWGLPPCTSHQASWGRQGSNPDLGIMRPTRCQVRCCRLRQCLYCPRNISSSITSGTQITRVQSAAVPSKHLRFISISENPRFSSFIKIVHSPDGACVSICLCLCSVSLLFLLSCSLSLSLSLFCSPSHSLCTNAMLYALPFFLFLSILFVSTALTPDKHGDARDNDRLHFA